MIPYRRMCPFNNNEVTLFTVQSWTRTLANVKVFSVLAWTGEDTAASLTVTTWTSSAEHRRTVHRLGIEPAVCSPQTRCCCQPHSVFGACVSCCIYWQCSTNLGVTHRPPSFQPWHAHTHTPLQILVLRSWNDFRFVFTRTKLHYKPAFSVL